MEIDALIRKEQDMGRVFVMVMVSVACISLFLSVVPQPCAASDARKITKEDLRNMLDNPAVTVIDVRVGVAWKSSYAKIKGAVWEDPGEVEAWAGKYPKNRTLVLYCS